MVNLTLNSTIFHLHKLLDILRSLRLVFNAEFSLLTGIDQLGLIRHAPFVAHLKVLQRFLRIHFLKHHVIVGGVLVVFVVLDLLAQFFGVLDQLVRDCQREGFFID